MISLLESIGIEATPAILKLADKYLGISPNAFFSLTSIVFYEYSMKKISLATLIYASIKFALIVIGKAIAKIADTIYRATAMAFKKYGLTLTTNINEHINAKARAR